MKYLGLILGNYVGRGVPFTSRQRIRWKPTLGKRIEEQDACRAGKGGFMAQTKIEETAGRLGRLVGRLEARRQTQMRKRKNETCSENKKNATQNRGGRGTIIGSASYHLAPRNPLRHTQVDIAFRLTSITSHNSALVLALGFALRVACVILSYSESERASGLAPLFKQSLKLQVPRCPVPQSRIHVGETTMIVLSPQQGQNAGLQDMTPDLPQNLPVQQFRTHSDHWKAYRISGAHSSDVLPFVVVQTGYYNSIKDHTTSRLPQRIA